MTEKEHKNLKIVEKVMAAIRMSTTEGSDHIVLPWGHMWKRDYGYDYTSGNYWSQGYGHNGHATTGWRSQTAIEYTEDEMRTHILDNLRKFEKSLNELGNV